MRACYFQSPCFVFLLLRAAISAPNICLALYTYNVLIQTLSHFELEPFATLLLRTDEKILSSE